MAHRVSFSNWPGLKPGVEGAPRKKRWASGLSLERCCLLLLLLLIVGVDDDDDDSGSKFSGTCN